MLTQTPLRFRLTLFVAAMIAALALGTGAILLGAASGGPGGRLGDVGKAIGLPDGGLRVELSCEPTYSGPFLGFLCLYGDGR